MTWFTYLTGLLIFGIGAGCKFLIPLHEWQALLPVAFGLGYLTLAEGMRSKPALRRLFLFLAILWSVVVLISMIPLAKEGFALWNRGGPELNQRTMRPELALQHACVMVVSVAYVVMAVLVFVRKSGAAKPASRENAPTADR